MTQGEVRIVNVVASARVQGGIDIEKVNLVLRGTDYNPEVFSGLVYRRRHPKATLIMFASGKITSVGTKSERQAKRAITVTIKEIEKAGGLIGDNTLGSIKIENVVGTLDLKLNIDLDDLLAKLPHSIHEPDQFPGLIHRPSTGKGVVLVFASGKLNATGAKTEQQLRKMLSKVARLIKAES